MLQLKNISKDYSVTNELTVHALKQVSLSFRRSEFVSILGPSGCGKTTLLNIIGGLDRYSDGDLVIGGNSTKGFRDADWNEYRNRTVGFVFQSYNLIPHISVLENVALSLTFAGVGKVERRRRAKEALARVGLSEQIKKRPNQLSGGQMQRVAIARAIVGNPDVILADEPTGALDTETGVQVMELLKQIAKDRLVILVTHNEELAHKYSTRIVRLLDGVVVDDSDPFDGNEPQPAAAPPQKRRRGKFWSKLASAFAISFRNLWTKRGRTFLTAFAGSIGIFGIAMVLAISGGMGNYVDYMQTEAVGDSAVTIGETAYSVNRILSIMQDMEGVGTQEYPDMQAVAPYERESFHTSTELSDEFIEYLGNMDSSWYKAVNYNYSISMHILQNDIYLPSWANYAAQMIEEDELIEENYDVLCHVEGTDGYPKDKAEISLVVDKFNRLSPSVLNAIGIAPTRDENGYKPIPFEEILEKGSYTIVLNDGWYSETDGVFKPLTSSNKTGQNLSKYQESISQNKLEIKIVSVLRRKNSSSTTDWLTSGVAYLPELSEFLLDDAANSRVGQAQLNSRDVNVLTGKSFTRPDFGTEEEKDASVRYQYTQALKSIGAFKSPTTVKIYPKDIDSKQQISGYIDRWNDSHDESQQVLYLDLTGLALNLMATFIDIVSWVLIAFSAVALIVSTVMISVITYTSVVERTKEIGVLRSIGAGKADVSAIFNAETAIIGTLAGLLGVLMALLVGVAINAVVFRLFGVAQIASFTVWIVLGMFALSVMLTVCAGLIPAGIAAKRDPVKCLRTE